MTLATFPRCFVLHKSQTSKQQRAGKKRESTWSRGRSGREADKGAQGPAAAAEAAAVPDTAATPLLASKAKT